MDQEGGGAEQTPGECGEEGKDAFLKQKIWAEEGATIVRSMKFPLRALTLNRVNRLAVQKEIFQGC